MVAVPTVGANFPKAVHDQVLALVKRRGISKSEFVKELVYAALNGEGSANPPKASPKLPKPPEPSEEPLHVFLADELREERGKAITRIADHLKRHPAKQEKEPPDRPKGVLGSVSGENCEDGECDHGHDWPVSPRYAEIAARKRKEADNRERDSTTLVTNEMESVGMPTRNTTRPIVAGRVRRSPWRSPWVALAVGVGGVGAIILAMAVLPPPTQPPAPA